LSTITLIVIWEAKTEVSMEGRKKVEFFREGPKFDGGN